MLLHLCSNVLESYGVELNMFQLTFHPNSRIVGIQILTQAFCGKLIAACRCQILDSCRIFVMLLCAHYNYSFLFFFFVHYNCLIYIFVYITVVEFCFCVHYSCIIYFTINFVHNTGAECFLLLILCTLQLLFVHIYLFLHKKREQCKSTCTL